MVSSGAYSNTRSLSRPPGALSGSSKSFSLGLDALNSTATGDNHFLGRRGEERWGSGVCTRRLVRMGEVEVKRGWVERRGVTCAKACAHAKGGEDWGETTAWIVHFESYSANPETDEYNVQQKHIAPSETIILNQEVKNAMLFQ